MSNLGVRNNNWLNIRYNSANDWVGQTGGDENDYAQFEDPSYGLRAADRVLENYGKKHGIDNLNDAISRFAPPEDNNPTPAYAKFVADRMGISPDETINLADPNTREKMIEAMVRFETPDAAQMYSADMLQQARAGNVEPNLITQFQATTAPVTSPSPTNNTGAITSTVDNDFIAQFMRSTKPSDEAASPENTALQYLQPGQAATVASLRRSPLTQNLEGAPELGVVSSTNLIETFQRGIRQGAQQQAADFLYMGAALEALSGDKEGTETRIKNARIREEFAAIPLQNMDTFGEVWEQPTIEGVLEQGAAGVGQIIPSLLTTIVGAGTGSVAMALGQATLKQSSRSAVKNLIKDSVMAVARKTATPDERKIAQGAWEAAQEAAELQAGRIAGFDLPAGSARDAFLRKQAADKAKVTAAGEKASAESLAKILSDARLSRSRALKTGALLGAGTSEFVPLAGQNVSEALESGRDIDAGQARRALAVAVPQAAIGVFGEVGLVKLLANKAQSKSVGANSVMGRLAAALGGGVVKGGTIEGGTEFLQEEIAIRNRMDMDDSFTDADANLRRLNALFIGFVGGGAIGGGGSVAVQGVKEVMGAASSLDANTVDLRAEAQEKAGEVFETAKTMASDIKDQTVALAAQSEIFDTARTMASDVKDRAAAAFNQSPADETTPESSRDIDAQITAMTSDDNPREAVWVAGKYENFTKNLADSFTLTVGRIAKLRINGKDTYVAHVRGRGTILSTNYEVVKAVQDSSASNASLAAALHYSHEKTDVDTLVVQATDANGNVLFEQTTNSQDLEVALANAKTQAPNASITTMSAEDAQIARTKRAQQDNVFDSFEDDVDGNNAGDAEVGSGVFEGDIRFHSFNKDGQTAEIYQSVDPFSNTFEGIDAARAAYSEVIGEEVDWKTATFGSMSKSVLNTAVKLSESNPGFIVEIVPREDGHSIQITATPDSVTYTFQDFTKESEPVQLALGPFLLRSIGKAKASLQRFRTVQLRKKGDAKWATVNPSDLVAAGKRINEVRDDSGFGKGIKNSRDGFLTILAELQLAGYEVAIKNVPIEDVLNNLANSKKTLPKDLANLIVDADGSVRLRQIAQPRGKTGAEQTVEVDAAPTTTTVIVTLDKKGNEISRRNVDLEEAARINPDQQVMDFAGSTANSEVGLVTRDNPDRGETETVSAEEAYNRRMDETGVEPMDIPLQAARNAGNVLDATTMQYDILFDSGRSRPKGRAPTTNKNEAPFTGTTAGNSVTFPFGEIGSEKTQTKDLLSFVRFLAARLKLKKPVAIIGMNKLQALVRTSLGKLMLRDSNKKNNPFVMTLQKLNFADADAVLQWLSSALEKNALTGQGIKIFDFVRNAEGATPSTITAGLLSHVVYTTLLTKTNNTTAAKTLTPELISRLQNTKKGKASIAAKLGDAYVITLDDRDVRNTAAYALALAHEFGHALFKEESGKLSSNPALRTQLVAAFNQDRAVEGGENIDQWNSPNEDKNFEEWYADQVAAWTKKLIEKPENLAESHFKQLAQKLVDLWKKLKIHKIFRRFNKITPEFDKYMEGVTEARQNDRETVMSPKYNQQGEIVGYEAGLAALNIDESVSLESEDAAATEATADPNTIVQPTSASMEQKTIVGAIREEIKNDFSQYDKNLLARFDAWLDGILQRVTAAYPQLTKVAGVLLTADTLLHTTAGRVVADMFYIRSNTEAEGDAQQGLGFVGERRRAARILRTKFFEVLGADWNTAEVQTAFVLAQDTTLTTDQLTGKAKQLRLALKEIHDEYIAPSNTNIGFRENYFPVFLNLPEVAADPAKLEALIFQYEPDADKKKVRNALQRILRFQQSADNTPDGLDIDDVALLDTGSAAVKSINLTKNIPVNVLAENGLLQDPEIAILSYVDRVTKRIEWDRHTKDASGKSLLLAKLDEVSPEQREIAVKIIHGYLGHHTPMTPFWRKTSSYLQTMNIMTLLPFASLASVPDFAGSIVNTREFAGFGMALKQIRATMNDPEASKRLAADIGVVVPEAVSNAFLSQADSDHLDPQVRLATDKFFKWTGLSYLTDLSREFAAGMGRQFILEHANHPTERSERYLRQLGLTAEQVKAWEKNEFSFAGPEGEAIKNGLVRFVESSVLRPNEAERPSWANDPRFALIWQLKSFLYAFNKVIIEGAQREAFIRAKEYNGKSVVAMGVAATLPLFAITAAAFLPLAALGLELREYAKVGLSYALPGIEGNLRYLRSDQMDYDTYLMELFSRAGFDGPFGILTMAQRNADWGGSAIASILGPTAELTERLIQDFPNVPATIAGRLNSPTEQAGAILAAGILGPSIYRGAKNIAATTTIARAAL